MEREDVLDEIMECEVLDAKYLMECEVLDEFE
jgi:hypothetical protein